MLSTVTGIFNIHYVPEVDCFPVIGCPYADRYLLLFILVSVVMIGTED